MAIEHIGQLKPDPKNARRHNPRNVGMVERALNEVGAARSIVIDEENVILAGNATIEAAAAAGIERVQVVESDGETIIAVRRTGLTAEQKTKLALYDNRAAELADGWDTDVLAELNAEIDLSGLFYKDELAKILEDAVTPYEPNIEPNSSAQFFTRQDIEQAKKDVEAKFKRNMALKPIICPHCAEEFYLDADTLTAPERDSGASPD